MMVCKVEVRGDWEEKSETMRGEKKKIKKDKNEPTYRDKE